MSATLKMMSDIKTIWFDLDDTLYDHTYSVCLGMNAVRARYPVLNQRSTKELAAFYNRALNLVYAAHVRGDIGFAEMRRRKLKLFYELSGIHQAEAPGMDDFHRVYDEGYGRERRATPGSIQVLERLSKEGVSLGILTNGKQAIQEDKLRVIGMEWMIPNLLTAERAKATKPDPRIYEWALAQTGLAPGDVLMVGDSVENDVEAALRCGLTAVLYAPNEVRRTVVTAHGVAPVINRWERLLDLRRDGVEPRHERADYAAPRSALTS